MENKLYDAQKEQKIELQISHGNKTFNVIHNLNPLSDERFIEFDKAGERQAEKAIAKSAINLETLLTDEKSKLWDELIISREGYKETSDWKSKTNLLQKISAINGLLFCQPFFTENENQEDELFDDDQIFDISLRSIFDGHEIITRHSLRSETLSELDGYLKILNNQPIKTNSLTSSAKSTAQRYADLYDVLHQSSINYQDNVVPIWHKIQVTIFHFENQLKQLNNLI